MPSWTSAISLLLATSLGAVAQGAGQREPLRLDSVFQVEEPAQPDAIPLHWPRYDPEGPPFAIPPPELFAASREAVKPRAIPPEAVEYNLPDLTPRGFGEGEQTRRVFEQPGFREIGLDRNAAPGRAIVHFENASSALALRIELWRPEDAPGNSYVLRLPPGSSETLFVPEGAYALRRTVWALNESWNPDSDSQRTWRIEEEFEPMALRERILYERRLDSHEERLIEKRRERETREPVLPSPPSLRNPGTGN